MELLTLTVSNAHPGAADGTDWLTLRQVALTPPAPSEGLRARWWRAGNRVLTGRFLFDHAHQAHTFLTHIQEQDPASAQLLSHGPVAQRVDSLSNKLLQSAFDRPTFIVSAPRAGSTLLHDALAQCEALWSIDAEAQVIFDGIPALSMPVRHYESQVLTAADATPDIALTLRACLLAELADCEGRYYLHSSEKLRPSSIQMIEKTTENALRLAFLKAVFPDARFIMLQRDLRQNVSSIVAAWQHSGFISLPALPSALREKTGAPSQPWCFLLPLGWQRYRDASLTDIAAFQWQAANSAILHEFEATDRARWTTVTYDNLIALPDASVRKLCKFIGVEPGERLAQYLAKSLPISATTITLPSPIKWKSNACFEPEKVKALQPLAGRMRNVQQTAAPDIKRTQSFSSIRFSCFADSLTEATALENLIVAPSLLAQVGNAVPIELLAKVRHRERFVQECPLLWVEDPATHVWNPVWLRQQQVWLCKTLSPSKPPPDQLSGKLKAQLVTAGALTTQAAIDNRASRGRQITQTGKAELELQRFCLLPALIGPVLTAALTHYYRAMITSGEWQLGDAQVAQRYGWHNERVARFLHTQLSQLMSAIAGIALKPTYAFASAYQGGAALDVHTDREQCDYTLSLLIDEFSPDDDSGWPLHFLTAMGKKTITLKVGDAVFFRGCELPHWRDAATKNHRQINLLFHFVPGNWRGVTD